MKGIYILVFQYDDNFLEIKIINMFIVYEFYGRFHYIAIIEN